MVSKFCLMVAAGLVSKIFRKGAKVRAALYSFLQDVQTACEGGGFFIYSAAGAQKNEYSSRIVSPTRSSAM